MVSADDASSCSCCFFFKQKTAYEIRISDWSSDVCSSDLHHVLRIVESKRHGKPSRRVHCTRQHLEILRISRNFLEQDSGRVVRLVDRKSVVSGKSVSVRVDLGGSRIIKKKKHTENICTITIRLTHIHMNKHGYNNS